MMRSDPLLPPTGPNYGYLYNPLYEEGVTDVDVTRTEIPYTQKKGGGGAGWPQNSKF